MAKSKLLTEWELWACANSYVSKHGVDAPILVAMRADELAEAGDERGAANFRAIVRRCNEMLAEPSGTLH